MDKVYFATTNEGKLREAKEILKLEILPTPLEIDEIQSLDPLKVAIRKAKDYYQILKKPIFIEDVSLSFNALSGFPGPYINDFLDVFKNPGLVNLLSGRKDRMAVAQSTVVYTDEKGSQHVFAGKMKGEIAHKPKGEGFGWDPIFIPYGSTKTLGEMSLEEKNKFSMCAKALRKFKKWLFQSNG